MLVSVIIPCKSKNDNIGALLKDISSQKISFDLEVIKMADIAPPGRARNEGAKKAKGDIFIFIDCDIRLGNEYFLSNLAGPLISDKNIGATCASIRMPPDSSGFQIRYAKEIAHTESPLVESLTDVAVASSACCAIRRDIFLKINGFNENIIRGEDSVISNDLSSAGYRVVLVPHTRCYHPQPENILQLIKIQIRNGVGVAFIDVFYPNLNIDVNPKGILYQSSKKTIMERIIRYILNSLWALLTIRILLFFSKIFYAFGYFYGYFNYRILKYRPKVR